MTMVRRAERPLPCGTTMSGVEEAGTTLMAASPPRPGKQQCRTPRRREDEVSQQMAHFGNGQRKQRAGWRCSFYLGRLSGEPALRSTNACKTCLNDHDERNISIPGGEAPDFVIGEPHFFPCLETFFNFPSRSDRLHHLRKRRAQRGKDEVICLVLRIVQWATHEQKVLAVLFTPMQHGHDCPIEQSRPLGSVAHRDPLPILGVKRKGLRLRHCHPFATGSRLQFRRLRTS